MKWVSANAARCIGKVCTNLVMFLWRFCAWKCNVGTWIYNDLCIVWIPWNLSFRYISFHEKRLQLMLLHHNARVNSHQRWKQMGFRICFHLWCELTITVNVMEWQVSWNSIFSHKVHKGVHFLSQGKRKIPLSPKTLTKRSTFSINCAKKFTFSLKSNPPPPSPLKPDYGPET